MSSRLEIPTFATEAEEADWLYENRELIDDDFAQAFDEGRVRPFNQVTPHVLGDSVLLNPEIAQKVRSIAEKRGVDYQSLVNEFIQKELEQVEKTEAA